jgi:hypothetical protein
MIGRRRRVRVGAAALITAMTLTLPLGGSVALAKGKPGSELARYSTPGSTRLPQRATA